MRVSSRLLSLPMAVCSRVPIEYCFLANGTKIVGENNLIQSGRHIVWKCIRIQVDSEGAKNEAKRKEFDHNCALLEETLVHGNSDYSYTHWVRSLLSSAKNQIISNLKFDAWWCIPKLSTQRGEGTEIFHQTQSCDFLRYGSIKRDQVFSTFPSQIVEPLFSRTKIKLISSMNMWKIHDCCLRGTESWIWWISFSMFLDWFQKWWFRIRQYWWLDYWRWFANCSCIRKHCTGRLSTGRFAL